MSIINKWNHRTASEMKLKRTDATKASGHDLCNDFLALPSGVVSEFPLVVIELAVKNRAQTSEAIPLKSAQSRES